MKIIFIGEEPVKTAPTLTWANCLKNVGANYTYIDLNKINTKYWIKEVLNSNIIICQWYAVIPGYEMRQLAIASLMGRAVIRKWSGSDVLYTINDIESCKSTKILNNITALNLTSEHIGLVQELATININCALTQQVVTGVTTKNTPLVKGKSVLAYLPDTRYEFYGRIYIENLIKDYPNINFIIIADTKHALNKYSNVTSLGWVDDMDPVWNKTGLLIRITEHDGFPRSVVEALARGKYVIHNREFDGVWYAANQEEIKFCFERFINSNSVNTAGLDSVNEIIDGRSSLQLLKTLEKTKVNLFKRIISLFYVTYLTFKKY